MSAMDVDVDVFEVAADQRSGVDQAGTMRVGLVDRQPAVTGPAPMDPAAKAAAEARVAKTIGALTHDQIKELNDRVHALSVSGPKWAIEAVAVMRCLARDEQQFWNMMMAYDVPKADDRDAYGKQVESAISDFNFIESYVDEFSESTTVKSLTKLKEDYDAHKVFFDDMKKMALERARREKRTTKIPKAPTDEKLKARFDRLSDDEREARLLAAAYGIGHQPVYAFILSAREEAKKTKAPQPDLENLLARYKEDLKRDKKEPLSVRIKSARDKERHFRSAVKNLDTHFPNRGAYHELVQPILDILSGKVDPRPDPELTFEEKNRDLPNPAAANWQILEEDGKPAMRLDRKGNKTNVEVGWTCFKQGPTTYPFTADHFRSTKDVRRDECIESMKAAQETVVDATKKRDALLPGSDEYNRDLAEIKQLHEKADRIKAEDHNLLRGEEETEQQYRGRMHMDTMDWKQRYHTAFANAKGAERAFFRRYMAASAIQKDVYTPTSDYLRNSLNRLVDPNPKPAAPATKGSVNPETYVTDFSAARDHVTYYRNLGLAYKKNADIAENHMYTFLSDEWKHANAKVQQCNNDVAFWAKELERIDPKPKVKPLSVKDRVRAFTKKYIAGLGEFKHPEPEAAWVGTARWIRFRERVQLIKGWPAHVRYIEDEDGHLVAIPTSEYRVPKDVPVVDPRSVEHNKRVAAAEAEFEKKAQLRYELIEQARRENHEADVAKANAERIRAEEEEAKRLQIEGTKDTLEGFDVQTKGILDGCLSKAAINKFACFKPKPKPKRKNAPDAIVPDPDVSVPMSVVDSPSSAKRAKAQ